MIRCNHAHPSLALALCVSRAPYQKLLQGLVQHLAVERPTGCHHAQIGLARAALAELVLQVFERAALLGHQQNPAGLAIQAVHQLQKVGLRPGHAQLLNHTKADARAAVYGYSSRLVDNQQLLIFKEHGEIFASAGLGRRGLGHGLCFACGLLREPHRR